MTLLLTDWDETITATDTLGLVAEAAYRANPGQVPWSTFGDAYMAEYTAFASKFGPRPTLARELEFLKAIETVETASVKRVERAGVFKNVTVEHLAETARAVEFRPGFANVLSKCRRLGIGIGIVSVNWSALFIRAALKHKFGDCDVAVYANEIEFRDGVGTGGLSAGQHSLRTGSDKAALLDRLREDRKVIYVGDSTGDLHALLEADLGVIMGSKKSLRETCERVGISVQKLAGKLENKKEGLASTLYSIDEWQELSDYL